MFISYGTGGAEALDILHKKLKNKYSSLNVSISEYASNKLTDFIYTDDIYHLIDNYKPSLVINERSNGLEYQNQITRYCKEKNIKKYLFVRLFR